MTWAFFSIICMKIIRALAKMEITDYPVAVLDEITALDIEEYMMYLKYYVHNGVEHTNDERGQMRKLATLRSFYNYFFRKEIISKNPASLVQMPKRHEKNIVRLDIDEVALLLDEAESGEKLTARQKMYHEKTKKRDLAHSDASAGAPGSVCQNVWDWISRISIPKTTALRSTARAAKK